ncbi:hypothetical protein H9Q13_09910 [Pontibacter sp. JH31]|uniref:DoxX-like family protein n=1 Tax=Pontibacter aquaedesilientis TaxID=2766980 RepID=A0ABR7XJ97_9BACT|nr:hypothetical protein [Pontibacter aquaedesilientis]MBD1397481.1 hypothetical protein [Pontibacter aquaedesilientis]
MKKGILSVLIGAIGLALITYFYYQTEVHYEEIGGVQHIATLYTMSLPLRIFLFTTEALGVILGYLAYRGKYAKTGLLGMGLCALCLILLYGYTF